MSIRLDNIIGRTLYADIRGLSDPFWISLTAQCYSNIARALILNAQGRNWYFGPRNIAAEGGSFWYNMHNFGYRERPLHESLDEVLVKLSASGGLLAQRQMGIHLIDSEDPCWDIDYEDNFDDGTKQGWTHLSGGDSSSVVSEYVMSSPFALRGTTFSAVQDTWQLIRIGKQITTPDKNEVYAILHCRAREQNNPPGATDGEFRELYFEGSSYWSRIGWDSAQAYGGKPPVDQWMKLMIPLPRNQTFYISVYGWFWVDNFFGCFGHLYIDDFKVISRN